MRVAIAGAGIAGAFLHALLNDADLGEVDIFDLPRRTKCGIRPCAWGFAPSSEYRRLASRILDPEQFELYHSNTITIDGVKIKADILTVDKAALINGFLQGSEIRNDPLNLERYDRVIDATGVNRAFLGPMENSDFVADCIQYRVKTKEQFDLWFRTSTLGYEWCFPLGADQYHIGKGSLKADISDFDPSQTMDQSADLKVLCKCSSRVRLTSPYFSRPFSLNDKIVGVGESIGTVAPMGADGNLYSMQCAEMLVEHWNDLKAYESEVLDRFDWMRKERRALEKLWNGKLPSMSDARIFIHHSKIAGFQMGPLYAMKLFRRSLR